MRMNLRRIREIQNLTLKELAERCHMDVERLRAIEQYKELPTFLEIIRILKQTNHYFDEVCAIIWNDIEEHYIPESYNEYTTIERSLKFAESSAEEIERRFPDDK